MNEQDESADPRYEFTGETMEVAGVAVRRIRSLRRIGWKPAGTLGGWIESERNLSQIARPDSRAWVGDDAVVMGDTRVAEDGMVMGDAVVKGRCVITGRGRVDGSARLEGNAHVRGNATVFGNAHIRGTVRITDHCQVNDNARISGAVWLSGTCSIGDNAVIYGHLDLHDARILGPAEINEAGHVVVLNGLTDGRVTMYRTPSLPLRHQLTVGCQIFDLNTDLPELAMEHDYRLTPAWEAMRTGLLEVVKTW